MLHNNKKKYLLKNSNTSSSKKKKKKVRGLRITFVLIFLTKSTACDVHAQLKTTSKAIRKRS